MDSHLDFHTARALLEWQVEFGVDEAICDAPVNRFEVAQAAPKAKPAAGSVPTAMAPVAGPDPVQIASQMARSAASLDALKAAMAAFEQCELKKGARNLVFADGAPEADVMIIGEAPGRDEDREGKPFVGPEGQLLDKMLAAIDLGRDASVYITSVLPWRPPQNRDPKPEEIAMMLPFLERHVALVQPKVIVLMGNISCQAVLGKRGITRLRGAWTTGFGLPVLPMFHPKYLRLNPEKKRESWADLLDLKAKLREAT